jgi:(6-4)DNA photolyase
MSDNGISLTPACERTVWILHDQLSPTLTSIVQTDSDVPIIMIENRRWADSVNHHRKKLVLTFSAMRHFADELAERGRCVDYYALGYDGSNGYKATADGDFVECLRRHVKRHGTKVLYITEPNEYALREEVQEAGRQTGVAIEFLPNDLWCMDKDEFSIWLNGQSNLVMENFYHEIRQRTGVLMEDGQPIGERWNYDGDNRVPPMDNMDFTLPPRFEPDSITREVMEMVEREFAGHMGAMEDFFWPVTNEQSESWLDDFIKHRLRLFGMYQDAMVKSSWHMYHSLISPLLNLGMLRAIDCAKKAESAYFSGDAPINSVEGFVRQVIGWREYMRGIYWARMPEYIESNFFDSDADIPEIFNHGETRMACLKIVLNQTHQFGYAHHIQRMMVAGNLLLLLGVKPNQAVNWFRGAYIDGCDWATVPNVLGMLLYADGGYIASKPYAVSANYISKMSNYCSKCVYCSRKRVGVKSCPINFLYWNFLHRHHDKLKKNKRMGMVLNLLRKKSDNEIRLIKQFSSNFTDLLADNGTDVKKKPSCVLA